MAMTRATTGGAAERRVRYGALTVALVAAVTTVCLLAVLLAARFGGRGDLTAIGANTISERTRLLVGRLEAPLEIAVSINVPEVVARAGPEGVQRVQDLLDALDAESELVTARLIDTASSGSAADLGEVVAALAANDDEAIAVTRLGIDRVRAALVATAGEVEAIAELVRGGGVVAADGGAQLAASLDELAAACRDAETTIGDTATASILGTSFPDPDAARAAASELLGYVTNFAAAAAEQPVIGPRAAARGA